MQITEDSKARFGSLLDTDGLQQEAYVWAGRAAASVSGICHLEMSLLVTLTRQLPLVQLRTVQIDLHCTLWLLSLDKMIDGWGKGVAVAVSALDTAKGNIILYVISRKEPVLP